MSSVSDESIRTSERRRRTLARVVSGGIAVGCAAGLFLLYRWAATPSEFGAPRVDPTTSIAVRLRGVPFAGFTDGKQAWSLWAGQVDLERGAGSTLSFTQRATLTDIRNGKLFDPAKSSTVDAGWRVMPVSETKTEQPRSVSATFSAKSGVYSPGLTEPPPAELAANYIMQWQFHMNGDVDLKTRSGDRLRAEHLTIYDMSRRKNMRPERRVVCSENVRFDYGRVQLQTNEARYDPVGRNLECMNGVRGVFKGGSLQADRLFYALKEGVIRCPEATSGTMNGIPFTAINMTIDTKHAIVTAGEITLHPSTSPDGAPNVPALGGVR